MPFKDESFDAAILIRTIHHLKNPPRALKEAIRILKPQGYFILEFANKLHFKAKIRALFRLDFNYFSNLESLEVGTVKNCNVPFLNHHPRYITNLLKKEGLQIIKMLSVSNFRSPICKKILPLKFLLFLEKLAQEIYASFCLGPSIFILAQKEAK